MNIIKKLKDARSFAADACRHTLEPLVYSAGIEAYALGVKAVSVHNHKAALLSKGQHDVWRKLEREIDPDKHYIWIHAASLGEFEQGRPVIERIKLEMPEKKILLTFFSPSGYEIRKDYDLADCVCYLPFDTAGKVRRFLNIVRPECAIFVKYEIWRNYLHELSERSIPTYLISAVFRPEQAFFKKQSAWYRYWLRWYTRIFVQDERSFNLLVNAGITNVEVAGDTRFDRVKDILKKRKHIPEVEKFTGNTVFTFVFGSSWPEDEEKYFDWILAHPEIKVIIAPHEFDNLRLRKLIRALDNRALLLSEMKNGTDTTGKQILIIDCFGLLSSVYAYADAAYVGGGFGVGIHNINEAAVYGIPVMFGPNNHKFIEARKLNECGGGICVSDKNEFERYADILLNDARERRLRGKAAAEYIASETGATDRIFARIFRINPTIRQD